MHQEIIQHRIKLERLFGYAEELQKTLDVDSEVVSHFTSYLCVRTSGYVESSVKIILREYVTSKTSDPRLVNLVDARLKRTMNPRKGAILNLTREFGKDWRDNLKGEIEGELVKSLEDIVDKRNDIAHGKDVDLSLNDLKRYFEDAKRVVEIIDQQCLSS